MLVLAFDTSASGFSIALVEDQKLLAQTNFFESGKQSELLIPEIEKILRSQKIWYQDLGLIAATNGPGSFTGTRIALTTARTLKAALNIPLIFVNCCEAIAFKHRQHDGKIIVAIDASGNEVFLAEFFCRNQKLETIREPLLVKLEEIKNFLPQDDFLLCGSAAALIQSDQENDFIEAEFIALLALEKIKDPQFIENSAALYLRDPRIGERKK